MRPLLLILLATPSQLLANEAPEVGRVLSLRGEVTRHAIGEAKGVPITRGERLFEGAVIRTGDDGTIRMVMKDKTILVLGPDSNLTLSHYRVKGKKRKARVHLFVGKLWARVTSLFGGDRNFEVSSSNAVAGVRGTELMVNVELSGKASVVNISGEVEVDNLHTRETVELVENQLMAVDATGAVTQEQVTPDGMKKIVGWVAASGGLDPDKAGDRATGAGLPPASDAPEAPEAPEPQEQSDPAEDVDDPGGQDTPLDLEPSSGNTRVRGRIEVRE